MTKVVSLEAAREYLQQLDLNYVVNSMCSPHYPLPRWTEEDALHCCQLYKNFLLLMKKHQPAPLVPTRHIDEFWHNHILYTKQYFHDCEQIFGHYLHHEPASPSDHPDNLIEAFQQTKRWYFEEFGQEL